MKVDIKSFLIGVLATINLFLLYGFTNSDNCDTYYNSDDIMREVKKIERGMSRIQNDVNGIESKVDSILREVRY